MKDYVDHLVHQIDEARRRGDLDHLLNAARDAVDQLMASAPEADDPLEVAHIRALDAARRIGYNAAADVWPGWSIDAPPRSPSQLSAAHRLAEQSKALVERLGKGPTARGNALWLIGAHELAQGNHEKALDAFHRAAAEYGNLPIPLVLTQGYIAITRDAAGWPLPGESAPTFGSIISRLEKDPSDAATRFRDQLLVARQIYPPRNATDLPRGSGQLSINIAQWRESPLPSRVTLEGRYTRLEPLDPSRHGDDLFASAQAPGAEERFRFLFDQPPADEAAMKQWLNKAAHSGDPLFFAVIDRDTGRAEGRQALMRITPAHGVIEIGSILWGPAIARTRVSTEALYLTASYIFDQLGYRRFEWKCDNNNEPSKRAARRFGFTFEGVFRQHMIVKGLNRDTAWFAMIDADWSRLKAGYEAWLAPDNFDNAGHQLSKLSLST